MSDHNYDDQIDETIAESQQALQRIEPTEPHGLRVVTPQDARNTSIAHTLDAAYAKASTLQLTPEESAKLMADFDDSDIRTGARGKENLIYLEHAAVRRRLMEVFGPGGWAIINRRSWLDEGGGWMYADIVLICRGCFVGESIGANRYGKNNSMINYADAVKGAESDALGRIAGTALGVGLQLWSKGFCDAWHQRNAAGTPKLGWVASGRVTTSTPPPPQQNAPSANVAPRAPHPMSDSPTTAAANTAARMAATPADVLPKGASEKTRDWAWQQLTTEFQGSDVTAYLSSQGWLDETHTWKLAHVPTSKQALAALADEIRATLPHDQEPAAADDDLPEEWAGVQFSIAPKGVKKSDWLAQGVTLGQMYRSDNPEDKKRLFGFAKSWTPEPWVGSDGKKKPVSQEDFDCRVAMDLFLDWRKQRGETEDA